MTLLEKIWMKENQKKVKQFPDKSWVNDREETGDGAVSWPRWYTQVILLITQMQNEHWQCKQKNCIRGAKI